MKTFILIMTLLSTLNVIAQRTKEGPLVIKKSLLRKALHHDIEAMEKIYRKYKLEQDTAYIVMDMMDYVHFDCMTALSFDQHSEKELFETDGFKENSAQVLKLQEIPQKGVTLYSLCDRQAYVASVDHKAPTNREILKNHLNAYLLINGELIPINTKVEFDIDNNGRRIGKWQKLEISSDSVQRE